MRCFLWRGKFKGIPNCIARKRASAAVNCGGRSPNRGKRMIIIGISIHCICLSGKYLNAHHFNPGITYVKNIKFVVAYNDAFFQFWNFFVVVDNKPG